MIFTPRTVAEVTGEIVERELALQREARAAQTSAAHASEAVKAPDNETAGSPEKRQHESVPKKKGKKGRKPKPPQPKVLSYGPRKKKVLPPEATKSEKQSRLQQPGQTLNPDHRLDERFKDRSNTCKICSAINESFHLNYGVSTCFSCRAFFRRTVQKNLQDKLKCRREGNCEVTPTCRDCRMCRFRKCVNMGMNASQVMDDQQKLVRFRRRIKRNRRESSGEEQLTGAPESASQGKDLSLGES